MYIVTDYAALKEDQLFIKSKKGGKEIWLFIFFQFVKKIGFFIIFRPSLFTIH